MTTIKLLDARRGLSRKCEELFKDAKIAEAIYRYLCDGIEECEDAEPERKKGKWVECDHEKWYGDTFAYKCSECDGAYHLNIEQTIAVWNFCPNCGADMRKETEDD